MRQRIQYLCLAAALILGLPARAEQWFSVTGPATEPASSLVEVDLDTLRMNDQGAQAAVRVTLDVLHAHAGGFGFRSFVATMQFDCQRRSLLLISAAYYPLPAGKGLRVGADSSASESGMSQALIESIPMAAQRALLKAACPGTPTSTTPTPAV